MSHRLHPDVHTHGLADNCLDCERAAEQLYLLDSETLTNLHTHLLSGRSARSDNEGRAMRSLEEALQLAQRLGYRQNTPTYQPGTHTT